MSYFPGYANESCYRCGRSDCNGDCARRGEPVEYEPTVTHHEKGFGHPSCDCHVCKDMRERAANRSRE